MFQLEMIYPRMITKYQLPQTINLLIKYQQERLMVTDYLRQESQM